MPAPEEIAMRHACIIMTAIVLGCGAAQAQSAASPPAIGATSPFGMLGASGSSGSSVTGIPLGATEIDPGGLSPASPACSPAGSSLLGGSGMTSAGAGSTFDGGGLAGIGPATAICTPSSPNV